MSERIHCFVPPLKKQDQMFLTPHKCLDLLEVGNARFYTRRPAKRNRRAEIRSTTDGQWPFAIVLGCIDSRVPTELIFDCGVGDIMSTRVAGNFVTDELLAGVEYAVHHLGAKLIVVLGHTGCGAVKLATSTTPRDAQTLQGKLQTLHSSILPAVEAWGGHQADPDPDKVAAFNVRLGCERILDRSDTIRGLVQSGKVGVVGAMYDVRTGKVDFTIKPLSSHKRYTNL